MDTEQPRFGMLGAGFISDYHIKGLQAAGADVVSIFSRTEEHAREKAHRYHIPEYTDDYEQVLARDDVDAVVIATPDFTHEDLSVAAAQAGKAIYLQKPMARSSAECRRIIDAAEDAGVPLYVSWMHRYLAEVVKTRQLLAEDAFGEIYTIRQRNATPGADWEAWFYKKENVGGGAVIQLGVHGIDLLRHMFGEIEAVQATTAMKIKERTLADGRVIRPDNEDMALALYRMASGAHVVHETVYHEIAGTDRFRMEFYGERGAGWLRTERGRLSLYAPDYLGHDGWFSPDLPQPNFGERQHRHFLDMLRGDAPDDGSAEDGLAALLVSEALYRSAESGEWVEINWSDNR